MVNVDDLEKLAEPPEVTYSQPKSSLLSKYNIPLNFLDFDYIDKCSNGKELEHILHILQSGEEGHYPQLIESAEKRLQLLKPDSKFLRKETPVLSSRYLNEDERNCLKNDLSDFVATVDKNDEELATLKGRERDVNLPKIRRNVGDVPIEKPNATCNTNRIKSTDYDSWDKYDVDTEILKLDLQEQRLHANVEPEERVIEKYKPKKSVRFKRNLTEAEALYEADREREKGNEEYKAGEYLGAYNYYTRSIDCTPTIAALTNRALVSLKLQRFHEVVEDCQNAIKEEPENVKAHMRLGLGFEGLYQYENALKQAEVVIRLDPNNVSAQTLANNCYKQLKKRGIFKSTRLNIIEIPTEEKNKKTVQNTEEKSSKTNSKNNKKTILKKQQHRLKKCSPKSSKFAIVPIPGTSTMQPPYYVRIDKTKHNQIVFQNDNIARQNQLLLHMSNVYDNSDEDDDDDCTVIHLDPQKKLNKSNEKQASKEVQCGEIVQNFEGISEHIKKVDVKREQIDTDDQINRSNNHLFVRELEELKSLQKNEHVCISNVPKSKYINTIELNHKPSDDREIANVNRSSLTINTSPQIEVLAARTTIRAAAEEQGGSGEPEARTPEPRDDIHMPYIFANTWNCLREDRSFTQHASVLRTLDLRNLPQIIGCKLDGTMLSELLEATYRHMTVVGEVWRVHDFVAALPRIPRYAAVRLFMTDVDVTYLNNLIQFLEQHGTSISKELREDLLPKRRV